MAVVYNEWKFIRQKNKNQQRMFQARDKLMLSRFSAHNSLNTITTQPLDLHLWLTPWIHNTEYKSLSCTNIIYKRCNHTTETLDIRVLWLRKNNILCPHHLEPGNASPPLGADEADEADEADSCAASDLRSFTTLPAVRFLRSQQYFTGKLEM